MWRPSILLFLPFFSRYSHDINFTMIMFERFLCNSCTTRVDLHNTNVMNKVKGGMICTVYMWIRYPFKIRRQNSGRGEGLSTFSDSKGPSKQITMSHYQQTLSLNCVTLFVDNKRYARIAHILKDDLYPSVHIIVIM